MVQTLRDVINTPGETAPGRYGPDQTAIIEASAVDSTLVIAFHDGAAAGGTIRQTPNS